MSIPEDPYGSTSAGSPVEKLAFEMPKVPGSDLTDVTFGTNDVLPKAVGCWQKLDRSLIHSIVDNYDLDLMIRLMLVVSNRFTKMTIGPRSYSLGVGTFLASNAFALERLYPHESFTNSAVHADKLGMLKQTLAKLAEGGWIDYGFGDLIGYKHQCLRVTVKNYRSLQSYDATNYVRIHRQLLDCELSKHSRNLAWFVRLSSIANTCPTTAGFCAIENVRRLYNRGVQFKTEIERLREQFDIRMEIPGVVVRVNEPEGMLLKQFAELQGVRPARPRKQRSEKVVNGGDYQPLTSLKLFGIE